MAIVSKHNIFICRIFLALFILANSGFTAVVRQCTMKSSHAMECCAKDAGHGTSKNRSGEVAIVGNPADCHFSSLAGGLANLSAVVEKESRTHSAGTSSPAPLFLRSIFSDAPSRSSLQSLPIHSHFSPFFGEKCILNSTFLI